MSEVTKVFYETRDEAHQIARRGEIVGFLEILPQSYESESLIIKVHLDHTSFPIASLMRKRISTAYDEFSEKILKQDGPSIKFEEPLVGSLEPDLKKTITPAYIIQ